MPTDTPRDAQSVPPEAWDEFVARSPSGHLLQSCTWGEFKARFGWSAQRIAIIKHDRILAAAQVMFRALPGGLWTTAYVPKGPLLISDPPSGSSSAALLSALHSACRLQRAILLKVEPDWEDEPQAHTWLRSQGFRLSQETVQPQRTVLVDLRPDEEEILAQMKPKARYNIRLAERKGISVRPGTAQDLPIFYGLLQVTGQRDGFGIHTQAYYSEAFRLFAAQQAVALLLAQYEGKTLAALMAFACGKKSWYMYGASSSEERQRMPNHLLQWEAMRWAKARGCETYDLWGIPDVDESELGPQMALAEEQGVLSTGLGGLYRFKRGFGGREVRYVGAYDYVYNRPLYRLLTAAWQRRKRRTA
jgi:lipid II:glycine glycyltransferase (peptidoglycan interpeptide bridge formation enzyme)